MSVLETIPGGTTQIILDSLVKFGITNEYLQAGIMGVVFKETLFIPKSEYSYRNTSAARLKTIFSFLKNMTDDQVNALKKDDVAFYEKIYGGKYGNDTYGDGWKYRGRGLNGITFKNYYKVLTKNLGVDFVNYPDKLNELQNASDAMAYYFADGLRSGKASGKMQARFGITSQDQISSLEQGVKLAVQMNAGWGTAFTHPIIQEGYLKALSVAPDFLPFIKASRFVSPVVKTTLDVLNPKKKRGRIILASFGGLVLIGTGIAIYKYKHA